MIVAYGLLAVLSLVAVVGFGLRYRRHGRDLDSWLTLALTLVVFADLHYVLAPALERLRAPERLPPAARLRACCSSASGARSARRSSGARSPRSARASPARSTTVSPSTSSRSRRRSACSRRAPTLEKILPRLKFAATAAQQEAQFAVLALSSAAGSAPFDAALRRYVDFLVADGALDVEVEIDPDVSLAPDEEIEVFRIVQEGLANARKHAGARHAEVSIVQRGGRRVVRVSRRRHRVRERATAGAGQGLKNMRSAGGFDRGRASRSARRPGQGTAIEVVLRPI